ncbi:unnamed protein product [Bemisia tabaci]|uniref:Multidrug resistance-associated protein lethal(2)03659 n=1 Tax=Bemisia tabaci TaxID=7038 RepID=A0A9P0AGR3_BEMTA|nr:unnamed protein product [Bemisia tabaci]
METGTKSYKVNPRDKAGVFSIVFFTWLWDIFKQSYSNVLGLNDISDPRRQDHAEYLGDQLEASWNEELKKYENPSLLRAIVRAFKRDFSVITALHLTNELFLSFCKPFFLGMLLSYFKENPIISREHAMIYAGLLIFTTCCTTLIMNHYQFTSQHLGQRACAAVISLIYRKCLRIDRSALGMSAPGQIINLMSNDVSRFEIVSVVLSFMWSAPIASVVVAYFLFSLVGYSAFVGMAIIFIVLPIQSYSGKLTSKYRYQVALRCDERVRLMDEVIAGVHVIKMYAWEKPFSALMEYARRMEVKILRKTSYLRGLYMTFNIFTTRAAMFATLVSFVLMGGTPSADVIFVVASYYSIIAQTMTGMFVRGYAEISEFLVSIRRLQKFLLLEEYQWRGRIGDVDASKAGRIEMENVSAWWSKQCNEAALSSIDLSIPNGQLVAVIGPVGAGKSALLQTILHELPLLSGKMNIYGRVSYCSQEPWVFASTVRQNILFGEPFSRKKYAQVIRVCMLQRDFDSFPNADFTLVGERGASLSGGQKARINLARAVYKDADIYLLDDPLSAVDAHVGKHLFQDCINGYLNGKTRILVTHQTQFLHQVNSIIKLENGKKEAEGTYQEVCKTAGDRENNVFEMEHDLEKDEFEDKPRRRLLSQSSVHSVRSTRTSNQSTMHGQTGDEVSLTGVDIYEFDNEPTTSSIEEELFALEAYKGSVTFGYLNSGSNICMAMLFISLFFAAQAFASLCDYFVPFWVGIEQDRIHSSKHSKDFDIQSLSEESFFEFVHGDFTQYVYVAVYSALVVLLFVIGLGRSMVFFNTCMKCSIGLHRNMFRSVVSTSLSFFHANPSGRILNRFSKDIGAIDELLPKCLMDSGQVFTMVIGSMIVTLTVNPLFAIPTVVLVILFYQIRKFYLHTSKNLKRIESLARGPVFTHLNATLHGLPTIRALGAKDVLIAEFDAHQDRHTCAIGLYSGGSVGFTLILDFFCNIFLTIVVFSFFFTDQADSGTAGLAITQIMSITFLIQWGMRQSAEVANQMTCVERVLLYSQLEPEPQPRSPKTVPVGWPTEGRIRFEEVYLSFNDDPPVLKNVTLEIKPREKIGIVGRTGAGKSSLISALFRLTKLEGTITIDGIDTSTITLFTLRSNISIIPQDPVLFSGNLRRNLDPFDQYSDEVLWTALEEVELKESVSETGGLQTKVTDGGGNFSVGQRQLICLARAIVRNNKVIILDEATANVDPKTDVLIQTTIQRKFNACTVLTIAHRLHTIMDSDKILVMDQGEAVEFDSAANLLKNRDGYFYSLVQETGPIVAAQLTRLANQNTVL